MIRCGREQVQLRRGDQSWDSFLASGSRRGADFQPHVADAGDATNILFSSGTTGAPVNNALADRVLSFTCTSGQPPSHCTVVKNSKTSKTHTYHTNESQAPNN